MKVIRKLGENFVGRMMLSSPGSSGHDPATAAMCFKPPITGKMLPMDGHALHRYHAQLAQQSSSFFAAAAAAGMGLFPPRPTLLPSHLHAAAAFSPFGTPLLRPTPLPHPGLVPLSQHPSLQHNPHLGAAPPAPPPSSVPPQPAGQQLPLSQPPSQAPPPPPPTSQQPPPGFLSPTLHQQHFEPQPSSVRGGGGGGSSSSASTPSSSSAAAAGASRPSTSKSAEQHHLQQQQQQQAAGGKSSGAPSRRTPQCSRCFNHGLNIEKKNHQPYCENRFCPCELCETTAERQDKMAAQISKRRSQKNAMSQGKQLDLSQPSTSKGLPQMDHSPAKRPRSLPEREKLLAQFMKFMGTHVDLSYFPLFVAVYNEIGNFKDFESELERAEREMGILESEAESCDIPLSVNTPIKPIATRATSAAAASAAAAAPPPSSSQPPLQQQPPGSTQQHHQHHHHQPPPPTQPQTSPPSTAAASSSSSSSLLTLPMTRASSPSSSSSSLLGMMSQPGTSAHHHMIVHPIPHLPHPTVTTII